MFQKIKEAGYEWDADKKELKNIKQKSTDKVKPKFHEGDWIVQENIGTYKVIEVCKSWYEVIDVEDNHYSIAFDKEYMCHFWTIQDAKEGDILVASNGSLFIFAKIKDNSAYYHFSLSKNGSKEISDGKHSWETAKYCYPANKKERELLFKEIEEAGYEWDDNKKELKKIEQKPVDRVKPKFRVGDTMRTQQEASDGITDGLPVVVSIDEEYYHCNNELIAIKD